jgi:hypothetical protein
MNPNFDDNFFINPDQRVLYRAVYRAATSVRPPQIGFFDPGEYRPHEANKMFDLLKDKLTLDEIKEVFEKVFEKTNRMYNIGLNGIAVIPFEKIQKINQMYEEAKNNYVNNKKGGRKSRKTRKTRKSRKSRKSKKSRKSRK